MHAALLVDGAGWRASLNLRVPDNMTMVPLPPYAPQLNPVERVWLYLRERFLSHRLHADYITVLDAAYQAWNRITPQRLQSLISHLRLSQVSS